MTTISTSRNRVITEEPEADDVFVQAILFGEGDTPGTVCGRSLRYLPVSHYQELVDWAVSIADQMAHRIYVVPLSYSDIRNTGRFAPICAAVASMTDQERGQMRQVVVTTAAEVMRDCDDAEIRASMFDVLRQLKVIHHAS